MNTDSKKQWDYDSTNKEYFLEDIKDEILNSSSSSEDLVTREKHSKLATNQIKFLRLKIIKSKFTVRELRRINNHSRSTLIRLKNKVWRMKNKSH